MIPRLLWKGDPSRAAEPHSGGQPAEPNATGKGRLQGEKNRNVKQPSMLTVAIGVCRSGGKFGHKLLMLLKKTRNSNKQKHLQLEHLKEWKVAAAGEPE